MSFALRAKAANDRGTPISESLETYFQASYSAGFLSISQDLAALTRSLLVASTLGGEMLTLHKLTPQISKTGSVLESQKPLTASSRGYADMSTGSGNQGDWGLVDQPQLRAQIRKVFRIVTITFLVAMTFSTIAGGDYRNAIDSGTHADVVRNFWCVFPVVQRSST